MRQSRLRPLVLASMAALAMLSACLTSPDEILATETPSPSPIPTETIDWFPATQTPTPRPIVEALPTTDLRPDIGELILEEGFEDADAWPATSSNTTTVAVSDQNIALTLRQRADYLLVTRDAPTIGNFYLEVTANPSLCRDTDEYGLIVRATPGGSQYRFSLSCDGKAKVERFYGGVLSIETEFVESSLIPAVAPSSSRLAVWASGEEMRFFVNDFHLFTVRDRVLNRGTIGVFIRTRSTEALSVSFSEMRLWALEP